MIETVMTALTATGDRSAFLAAIKAQPDCLTARLVFADWLDEFGTSDLDAATAEFIRVACRSRYRTSRQMPPAAYEWVERHWGRLLPSVLFEHVVCPQPVYFRYGRSVWFAFRGREKDPVTGDLVPWDRPRSTLWRFDRGFLDLARVYSRQAVRVLRPLVAADQPLARFVGGSNP